MKRGVTVLVALCLGLVAVIMWPSEPQHRGTPSCADAVQALVEVIDTSHETASAAVTAAQEAADAAEVRACLAGGRQT